MLLGTATLLDGRVELSEKVPLALALRDEIEATPEGEVPDLGAVFDARGAGDDAELATVRDDLVASIEDGLTRAFRPAFLSAAALALLALLPALAVAGRLRSRRTTAVGGAVLAVALVGGGAVVGVALARGSWDQGVYAAADPCTTTPDPYPVGGLDGFAQNAALGALNGAACELGVSREELVLSIDPDSGFADVQLGRRHRRAGHPLGSGALDRRPRGAGIDPWSRVVRAEGAGRAGARRLGAGPARHRAARLTA